MKTSTKARYAFPAVLATGLLLTSGCASRNPRVVPAPEAIPLAPAPSRVTPAPVVLHSSPAPVMPLTPQPLTSSYRPVKPAAGVPLEGEKYVVKKGDLLSGIAYRYGVNWKDLAEYNGIQNPNSIKVGTTLVIPPYAKKKPAAVSSVSPAPAATPRAAAVPGGTYVVQSGDSLWLIARRNNTTVAELKRVNNLSKDTVKIGQKLKLPGAGAVESTGTSVAVNPGTTRPVTTSTQVVAVPTPRPVPTVEITLPPAGGVPPSGAATPTNRTPSGREFPIVVEPGETLEDIARAYIVPIEEIRRINDLGPNDAVQPGTTLLIPQSVF